MKAVLLATFACGVASFAADVPKPDVRVVDQIVAKVNGDIVSQDEIQKVSRETQMEMRSQGLQGQQAEQMIHEKMTNALRDRIDELLLIQKGKELNINVDSEVTPSI